MERDMKSSKELKRGLIDKLKEIQRFSQGEISPDGLPFDLPAELGEVVAAEVKSPGVYYVGTRQEGDISKHAEVYVVTADAPAISEKARTCGQEFPGRPDLCLYDIHQLGSGRYVIDFEMRRYQIKRHLPKVEHADSLYTAALYGAEENPDYFGAFPVPFFTPRGYTVRHKAILNGIYWLETDRCEEMLAVCYPIWQTDITISEQNQGEQLEYDRIRGIDNTFGYLFFSKQSSAIPLYELSRFHPEINESGVVDMAALLNAICKSYPEYAAIHNEEESESEHGDFIRETPGAGIEFVRF